MVKVTDKQIAQLLSLSYLTDEDLDEVPPAASLYEIPQRDLCDSDSNEAQGMSRASALKEILPNADARIMRHAESEAALWEWVTSIVRLLSKARCEQVALWDGKATICRGYYVCHESHLIKAMRSR